MSFFGRSGGGAPSGGSPGNYSRVPPNPGYSAPLPSNPRSSQQSQRVPPPRADDQYEKRSYDRRAPSPYGQQGHAASRWAVDSFNAEIAKALL